MITTTFYIKILIMFNILTNINIEISDKIKDRVDESALFWLNMIKKEHDEWALGFIS